MTIGTDGRLTGRAARGPLGPAVLALAVWLLMPFGAAGPAAAEEQTVDAKYRIFFAGIPLANATLNLRMKDGAYAADVKMAPTGVGTIVSASRTSVQSGGRVRGNRVEPARYKVSSKDNRQEILVEMDMSRGNVSSVHAWPPLKPSPQRIPVRQSHMRGVVDPLSSGLMPYPASRQLDGRACDRTLQIFDGWTRYDVRLSHRRTETVDIGDYRGPAVVCGARWVPVSGHRPNRESVRYLKANRGLEVTLIPIPDAGVLIPAGVEIETRNGQLSIRTMSLEIRPTRLASRD